MRNHQHPWNLRRIFGRQFVGYVGRPSCLKAGIAARVISAQSSRWTSREPEDADLPTCRLADLVVGDHWDSDPRTLLRLQFRRFLNLQENYRGIRLKPRIHHPPTLPKPQQLSKGVFRCHRSASSSTPQPPFPMETAKNQIYLEKVTINKQKLIYNHAN